MVSEAEYHERERERAIEKDRQYNKHDNRLEEHKIWLQKQSDKAIKSHLCKECGGVIVKSYVTSLMAMSYGKRCECNHQR